MKIPLFLITLVILTACEAPGARVDEPQDAAICPESPGRLQDKPEKVVLASSLQTLSNSLKSQSDIAYSFNGKKGQTLSYNLSDDSVCMVVYAWDLTPLDSSNLSLPQDGEYIIQLSTAKDVDTFELDIGLDVQNKSTPASAPATTPQPTATTTGLSQEDAVAIVQSWLDAKARLFAPPFDVEPVSRLAVTSGPLYKRTMGSSGSVQWLKSNGYYYTYTTSKVNKVVAYEPSANNHFSLKVEILEDLALYSPKGLDRSKSGKSIGTYEYILQKEGNAWKIYSSGAI